MASPNAMDMHLDFSKLWEMVRDRKAWCAAVHGVTKSQTKLGNITILMAESEEELKSFLMKMKEESEKAGLKLNIQKAKIMASDPLTSWQVRKKWKW